MPYWDLTLAGTGMVIISIPAPLFSQFEPWLNTSHQIRPLVSSIVYCYCFKQWRSQYILFLNRGPCDRGAAGLKGPARGLPERSSRRNPLARDPNNLFAEGLKIVAMLLVSSTTHWHCHSLPVTRNIYITANAILVVNALPSFAIANKFFKCI